MKKTKTRFKHNLLKPERTREIINGQSRLYALKSMNIPVEYTSNLDIKRAK